MARATGLAMNSGILDGTIDYDGSALRSRFAFERAGLAPPCVVAFEGRCDVAPEHMVDLVDRREGAAIRAERMLHFLAEVTPADPLASVLWQRLAVRSAARWLELRTGAGLSVEGDDLYVEGRKLSVSVATVSPVSSLFHLGLNVDPAGAPVPAVGLEELGLPAREAAEALLELWVAEWEDVQRAVATVRWVP